jgi:hypothetical protein
MAGVNYERYYEQWKEVYQIQKRGNKFIVFKANRKNWDLLPKYTSRDEADKEIRRLIAIQHLGSVAGEFMDKLIKDYENILTDQEVLAELVEQVEMYKKP